MRLDIGTLEGTLVLLSPYSPSGTPVGGLIEPAFRLPTLPRRRQHETQSPHVDHLVHSIHGIGDAKLVASSGRRWRHHKSYSPIWTNSTTLGNSNLFQTGGKVGIGTTSPAATLDVTGANGSANVSGGNAPMAFQVTGGLGASNLTGFGLQGAGGSIKIISGAGRAVLSTQGGKGATVLITGGGGANCMPASVGCAKITPGNGGSVTLQPGGGGFPLGHTGNVLLSPTGGNVGIGVTSPTHSLEIKVGGTTLADAWTTRSSRQFKANIQPLQGALEKVERLQGVSYERKSDAKREIGVIAEDVEEIVPEVVSRDSETHDVEGVDYSRLTALLIEAVKSQQAELRTQQSEIQQLKAKVEQLPSNSSGH